MKLSGADLIRIAQLIKLAAEQAACFSNTVANGEISKVTSAVKRINQAVEELIEAGIEIDKKAAIPE